MANQFRWVPAIVILTLLVSVTLFQIATSRVRSKSFIAIDSKGIRGQELVAAKHHRERTDEAVVKYSNHRHPSPEIYQDSGYQYLTVRQLDETETGGSRIWKEERKFYTKRQIPGGPDAHHHDGKGL